MHLTMRVDDQGAWLGDGIPDSHLVHQATGMSMVQLGGITSAIAFARLRAHAFAQGRTLDGAGDAPETP